VAHKLNQEATLDFAVRGDRLNVWVNGQLKLVYKLPTPRQNGTFALWTVDAQAEFLEVRVDALPESVTLAENLSEVRPSPLDEVTPRTAADFERRVKVVEGTVAIAQKKLASAQAAQTATDARIAAERAKYADPPDARLNELAMTASQAERRARVLAAEAALLQEEQAVAQARAVPMPDDPTSKKALADAEQKLAAAQKVLTGAQAAAMKKDAGYTPILTAMPTGSTGRRLALARWITSRDNPLTARVAVNHVWLRHFGKPLVPSVANFGLAGKRPTHPELLDWLAVELMDSGWSMKKLHRLIVTSAAYRMSSGNAQPGDPENRWLCRMNPHRMESEVVRDSLLALAGQLDLAQGGPIIDEKQGLTSHRRSVYFRLSTEHKIPFLELFDQASPNECYERRESVVPQQALALSNSSLALSMARLLAKRLMQDAKVAASDTAFVAAAFEQVLCRAPTAEEQTRCERFLREQTELLKNPAKLTPFPADGAGVTPPSADPAQRARENLIHVLFNHNDFVTIR
jgi:hypothetical protein